MKTVKIELNDAEIETVLDALDEMADGACDEEGEEYLLDLMKKISKAQKQLKKEPA